MKPKLIIHRVTIKALPLYTCAECGRQQHGSTFIKEVDLIGEASELVAVIDKLYISNAHMPIGWTGYGAYIHRCRACVDARNLPTPPCMESGGPTDYSMGEKSCGSVADGYDGCCYCGAPDHGHKQCPRYGIYL